MMPANTDARLANNRERPLLGWRAFCAYLIIFYFCYIMLERSTIEGWRIQMAEDRNGVSEPGEQYPIRDGMLVGICVGPWLRPQGRTGKLSTAEKREQEKYYEDQVAAIRNLIKQRDAEIARATQLAQAKREQSALIEQLRAQLGLVYDAEACLAAAAESREQAGKLHARGLGIFQEFALQSGLRLRKVRSELIPDGCMVCFARIGAHKVRVTVYANRGEVVIFGTGSGAEEVAEFQFRGTQPTQSQYAGIVAVLVSGADKSRRMAMKVR